MERRHKAEYNSTIGPSVSSLSMHRPLEDGFLSGSTVFPHHTGNVAVPSQEVTELREIRERLLAETERLKVTEKELRAKMEASLAKEREMLRQKEEELERQQYQQHLKYEEELRRFQNSLRKEFYEQKAAMIEQERKLEQALMQANEDTITSTLKQQKGSTLSNDMEDENVQQAGSGSLVENTSRKPKSKSSNSNAVRLDYSKNKPKDSSNNMQTQDLIVQMQQLLQQQASEYEQKLRQMQEQTQQQISKAHAELLHEKELAEQLPKQINTPEQGHYKVLELEHLVDSTKKAKKEKKQKKEKKKKGEKSPKRSVDENGNESESSKSSRASHSNQSNEKEKSKRDKSKSPKARAASGHESAKLPEESTKSDSTPEIHRTSRKSPEPLNLPTVGHCKFQAFLFKCLPQTQIHHWSCDRISTVDTITPRKMFDQLCIKQLLL
jgi:hypothetical protein